MSDSKPPPIQLYSIIPAIFGNYAKECGVDRKTVAIGLSNAALMKELFQETQNGIIVDSESVAEFVKRSQEDTRPWERYRAHEALRLAFLWVCEERKSAGTESLYPTDFHDTDQPLVDWYINVELTTPVKPRGPDPRENEPDDVLITMLLAALKVDGINPTKNEATDNDRACGADLVARDWRPIARKKVTPGTVAKVWEKSPRPATCGRR